MSLSLIKFEGKSLEKLVDAVTKGVGNLLYPGQIRREADARAYELLTLEKAKTQAKLESKEQEEEFLNRMHQRTLQKEIRRQINIDNIVIETAKELENATVNDEPVNEDWAVRFFNYAQDISDEMLQKLWSNILAGETRQPNSFSLRTLEILKNLNKSEAEILIKLSKYAITDSQREYFILNHPLILPTDEIKFTDRLLLSDLNLLMMEEINLRSKIKTIDGTERNQSLFFQGSIGIKVHLEANSHLDTSVLRFTTSGNEILRLIEINDNKIYLKRIYNQITKKGFNCEFVKVTLNSENVLTFDPISDY